MATLPGAISVDNGTAFTALALDHWAYTHRVELDYSRAGTPAAYRTGGRLVPDRNRLLMLGMT